jgi:hypothetical protein
MAKLKGSSLIEALIAMVVISISFGIGTIIFVSIYKNNTIKNTFVANQIIEQEFRNCINTKNFIDNEKKVNDFVIVQKIEKMDNENEMAWLKIVAYKEDKQIANHTQIINYSE